jgi:hypothetical protein
MAVLRLLAGIAAIAPVAYAVWRVGLLFGGQGILRNYALLPLPLSALTLGALLLWFCVLGSDPMQRRRFAGAALGGFLLGVIGFVVGFVGPIIAWPEANQGPLIGILFTGPLGFILGCIVGALIAEWSTRSRPLPG